MTCCLFYCTTRVDARSFPWGYLYESHILLRMHRSWVQIHCSALLRKVSLNLFSGSTQAMWGNLGSQLGRWRNTRSSYSLTTAWALSSLSNCSFDVKFTNTSTTYEVTVLGIPNYWHNPINNQSEYSYWLHTSCNWQQGELYFGDSSKMSTCYATSQKKISWLLLICTKSIYGYIAFLMHFHILNRKFKISKRKFTDY